MASETQDRSAQGQSGLPEFDAPPVFETVFGVRFPKLKWDIPHFGLYWDAIRADYPKFEVHPPLMEPGPKKGTLEGITLQLTTTPEARCWFLEEGGGRLIQVQHDGFFYNWRKGTPEEEYPRYEQSIRPAFEAEWDRFREFLSGEEIGVSEVVECEATYVNHFERGREWKSAEDLRGVVRWWAGTPEVLPTPKAISIQARFQVDTDMLDVTLTPAVRREGGLEILRFQLTVKGQPASSDPSDVMVWMDRARATIVRSFTNLTTEKMHKIWKRTS